MGGKERERGMGGKGRKGKGRGREREGRGGKAREGGLTPTFVYPPPPLHIITNRENFHFKVLNRLSTTSAGFY